MIVIRNPLSAMKTNPSRRRAFTLIELLVVIGIIGVLAALLMPALAAVRTYAAKTRAHNEIHLLATAIEQYYQAYGHFPVSQAAQTQAAANAITNGDFTYGGTYDSTIGKIAVGSPGLFLTNSDVMAILMDFATYPGTSTSTVNTNHQSNPKGVHYLTPTMSQDNTSPGVGQDLVYRDPWGHPYIITFDLNYDGLCNGDVYGTKAVSQSEPNSQQGFNRLFNKVDANGNGDHFQFTGKFMIWSAGPDGKIDSTQSANVGVNKDNVLSW